MPRSFEYRATETFPRLAIPLIYKSEVMGVIALEKREADYYDNEVIQAATTFAGQAAVSLENARLQASRIARTRGLTEAEVRRLIEAVAEGRELGIFGEPRVNVLLLNSALDGAGHGGK